MRMRRGVLPRSVAVLWEQRDRSRGDRSWSVFRPSRRAERGAREQRGSSAGPGCGGGRRGAWRDNGGAERLLWLQPRWRSSHAKFPVCSWAPKGRNLKLLLLVKLSLGSVGQEMKDNFLSAWQRSSKLWWKNIHGYL